VLKTGRVLNVLVSVSFNGKISRFQQVIASLKPLWPG